MTLVMVKDFVVKGDACAHLNIITKRTALFMDVSLKILLWKFSQIYFILLPADFCPIFILSSFLAHSSAASFKSDFYSPCVPLIELLDIKGYE